MKKLLSCLLAVVLVITLSLSAVTLISAKVDPTFVVSSATLNPGESTDITISLKNNPGITSAKITVAFDSALTLNTITYNTAELGGQAQQPQTKTSPVILNWINGAADTVGDMVFVTLNFTVADSATAGDKAITVTYDEDDVFNIGDDNVTFAVENGKITVAGQEEPGNEGDATFAVSSETAKKGDTKDITISLVNNPGITSAKITVAFDSALTLNTITYNTSELGGQAQQPQTKTSPVILNWINGAADTVGDMVFVTLNFTVSDNATAGDKAITVTYDEDDVFNIGDDNVTFAVENGKITVEDDEIQGGDNDSATFAVSSATAEKGESKDITISLKNNPGITSAKITVAFDSALTLNTITYNTAELGGQAQQPQTKTSPVILNWINGAADTVGDMVFVTLNFTVADSATAGDKPITVTYDADDVFNIDDDNVTFAVENGKITVTSSGEEPPECTHTNTTTIPAVPSTCITKGHGELVKCIDCGEILLGEDYELDPTNHEGGTEVRGAVPATCTAEGYTGDTYCLGCGAKISSGSPIAKTAHTYSAVVTPPTCTEQGYTTHTCTGCGDSYVDTYVKALGHTGGTANCHAKAICTRCQTAYGDLDPNNHDGGTEVRDATASTCGEAGYTGDTYCLGCGAKIAKGEQVDSLPHTEKYASDSENHWKVCSVCAATLSDSEPHTFEWKVVKEATVDEEGLEKEICSVCGYEGASKAIDKLTSYDIVSVDGKKEADEVVYDSTDSKAIAVTAKFAKTKLKTVKVNGVEVSSDNYDLTEDSEGNVKVTLKESYLKTLAAGDYKIELFTNDGVAQTTVTVKSAAAGTDTTNTGTDTNSDGEKSPKSSDSDIVLMVMALLAVMGVSVFTGIYRRKREDR